MDLESLPPEIISHILRAIDSPRHLYRLLAASPVCLRVFSPSPTIILSSVLRNIIPSYALDHYLVLLNIPARTGEHDSWTLQQLGPFLQLYFKSAPFNWPTSKKGLYALCRIHNRLSYFLDGYLDKIVKEFSPIFDNKHACNFKDGDVNYDNTTTTTLSPLPSKSEDFRLQRGFLRFELYCRIFSVYQNGRQYAVVASADQFSLFLAHLQPWEVEEICCVYQHFASTARSYFNDLEDLFVSAALDYSDVMKHSAPVPGQPPSPETDQIANGDESLVSVENLKFGGLELFSKDFEHSMPCHISSIVSLGFDFLYELVRATETRRAEMIRANHHALNGFLPIALLDCLVSETAIVQTDNTNDDLSHINPGYRAFGFLNGRRYPDIFYDFEGYDFLRHLGYVFWDADKISDPCINKRLWNAKQTKSYEMRVRFGRTHHNSAEERLTGVLLPRKALRQLDREFGSTRNTYLLYSKARGIRYFGEEWFNYLARERNC